MDVQNTKDLNHGSYLKGDEEIDILLISDRYGQQFIELKKNH